MPSLLLKGKVFCWRHYSSKNKQPLAQTSQTGSQVLYSLGYSLAALANRTLAAGLVLHKATYSLTPYRLYFAPGISPPTRPGRILASQRKEAHSK